MNHQRFISKQNIDSIGLILLICGSSFAVGNYLFNSILILPLLLSIFFSGLATYLGIPKLKNLKIKQIIREEGPKEHQNKYGTPTMGGLIIVPIGIIIGSIVSVNESNAGQLSALIYLILSFMIIGAIDDWLSICSKKNSGLSAKKKLFLQLILGMIFLKWSISQGWISSIITIPLGLSFNIGFFIWPLALFVLLAESNATNLTDGLDGLASGCGALVFCGLAIQLMLRNNNGDPEIATFAIALAGSWLGFLWFNKNPAKIFMGDTGSLAMGAALSGIALISDSLWALLVMGGVFFAESLSVIFQVSIFKISKRITGNGFRIFRMTPLHHHFELRGTEEQKIVKNFWIVTVGLILLHLFLLKS